LNEPLPTRNKQEVNEINPVGGGEGEGEKLLPGAPMGVRAHPKLVRQARLPSDDVSPSYRPRHSSLSFEMMRAQGDVPQRVIQHQHSLFSMLGWTGRSGWGPTPRSVPLAEEEEDAERAGRQAGLVGGLALLVLVLVLLTWYVIFRTKHDS
jgi:hypothetical protein